MGWIIEREDDDEHINVYLPISENLWHIEVQVPFNEDWAAATLKAIQQACEL